MRWTHCSVHSKSIWLILSCFVLGGLFGQEAGAARLLVPDDWPTIQAGIDAAADGDTVLVAPGRYFENIDFRGGEIVVASRYLLEEEYRYVRSTVIDGSGSANPGTATPLSTGEWLTVLRAGGSPATGALQGSATIQFAPIRPTTGPGW